MKKNLLFVLMAALITFASCDSFDNSQQFMGNYKCTFSGTKTISTITGDKVETFENEPLGVNVLISPTATPDEVNIIALAQGATWRAKVSGNKLTIIEEEKEYTVLDVPVMGTTTGTGTLTDNTLILDFVTTSTATIEIMNIPTNVEYTNDMTWTMVKKSK